MSNGISIREFARNLGVSDVAVLKAIKAGKIVKGIDYSNPKRPKVNPKVAAEEWGRNWDPTRASAQPLRERFEPTKAKPISVDKKPKVDAVAGKTPPGSTDGESGRSLAEIKRQTAEVRLRLDALELKERMGQLVDKDAVYRALFAAGQEVRTALQAIPDRVIDDVLAARSRNESHQVLYNAIADALEMLNEISERPISK